MVNSTTMSVVLPKVTKNGDIEDTKGVPLSCFVILDWSNVPNPRLFVSSYIASIAFDALNFILAVLKMGRRLTEIRTCASQPSLVEILLRDGIILYLTLAISNVTNFIIFMRAFFFLEWDTLFTNTLFVVSSGTNGEMTHALSTILISRMIFNLREAVELSEFPCTIRLFFKEENKERKRAR
ncbi:hypothetical protein SCHPADRAFT_224716 [Schizopora paradoxa]|uniref:Uncharacterized protein n=1 Tax=Schizopora paradoxa TaxID=27342 RepID=A0A0H2RWG8_9AGAM|nr:hypothetical protein SCHPADRAFT_224716 [Schizopora paradoxa]